ncbi:MAG: 3-oxoacyl-[acyl-carrier-protein] reductase [Candidatus Aenigmatarchaeota archaeon]
MTGKIALVTGGSRGIGRAVALELSRSDFFVFVNYNSNETEAKKTASMITESGGDTAIIKADVSDFAQVERMFAEIASKSGGVDVLVNNAGINSDRTLKNMTAEQWDSVIRTNLTGTFNCTKNALEYMKNKKWGRIINISSVIGQMGNIGQANYAAAKAGIIGFTKSIAKECAKYGVTVNAIAPGFIETDMVKSIPEEIKQKIVQQIPVGRFGKPEEVAKLAAYLASDDSSYMTGQVIGINGGFYI